MKGHAHLSSTTGIIFAADATNVVAGAFNSLWLAGHWLGAADRGRRFAAASLAIVNGGIATEAAFAQTLFLAHRFGWAQGPLFGPVPWLAARLPVLAGTLLLSMLILRRAR